MRHILLQNAPFYYKMPQLLQIATILFQIATILLCLLLIATVHSACIPPGI